MTAVFIGEKRRNFKIRHTDNTEENSVKIQAETGVTQLQSKELQRLPAVTRS